MNKKKLAQWFKKMAQPKGPRKQPTHRLQVGELETRITPVIETFTVSPGAAIADGSGNGTNGTSGAPTISSQVVTTSANTSVTDVNVTLNINHTWQGDLVVTLSDGTNTALLVNRVGRTGTTVGNGSANFVNLVLDDEAATNVHAAPNVSNLTGTFQPDNTSNNSGMTPTPPAPAPLSVFDGLSGNRIWTLEVRDYAGSDTGTLVSWTLTLDGVGGNVAPTITSANMANTAEGTTGVLTVTSTDPDLDTPTYSIIGGADAGLFSIVPATGVLTFNSAPNFETPSDAGANNVYDVTVQADDGNGGLTSQAIAVTVTNVTPTAPTDANGTANTVAEGAATNTVVNLTAASTDPAGPQAGGLVYSITADTSAGGFQIDSNTGVVTVADGTLLDGGTTHTITVQVFDGTATNSSNFIIGVTNVSPTATPSSTLPVLLPVSPVSAIPVIVRNSPYTFTLTNITDPAVDNDTYTVTWDWDGDNVVDVEDVVTTPIAHGATTSATYDFPNTGTFTVRATVTDEDGGSTQYTFPLTVAVVVLQGNGELHVGGTDGNNTFMYDPGTVAGSLRVFVDGTFYGQYNPSGPVRTFGGDLVDTVTIRGTTAADTFGVGADETADLVHDKTFTLNGRTYTTRNAESYFLKGGEGNDTFNVSGLGGDSMPTPTTAVDLQGDNGDDVINASTLGLTDVDGSTSAAADWLFQSPQRGSLEGVLTFNTMQAIVGTGVNDTVRFVNGGSMPGFGANPGFTGGAGTDTLDLTNQLSAATIFVQANGNLNTPAGNYAGIDSLVGTGGSDKLVGANLANTWTVTGANSGTFQGGANPLLAFSSIESHQGNAGVDTFIIPTGGTLSGSVDGQTGTGDILNLSGRTGSLTVGVSPATVKDASLASPFNVVSGYTAIEIINGGTALNTLNGSNGVNTWTLTGANDGTLNALTFTDFGTLVGGTSNDTYRLGDVNGSAVSLVGGSGTDTLTYSAAAVTATPVNVTMTSTTGGTETRAGTFSGIDSIVGSTGSDTLTGTASADQFVVNAASAGTFNGTTTFSSFENLVGAAGNDSYTITTTVATPVSNITAGANTDTLTGANRTNAWVMSGAAGMGTLNGTLSFTGIENLNGNAGIDTFNLNSGSLGGTLNGGGNTDTLTLPGTAANNVTLSTSNAGSTALITGGFTSIESLVSGGGATLTGPNLANTWRLTGPTNDVGTLNSVLSFNGFTNYVGGTLADRLMVLTGRVSGTFDGAGGSDVLDYAGVTMDRPYLPAQYVGTLASGSFRSGLVGNALMNILNFEVIQAQM